VSCSVQKVLCIQGGSCLNTILERVKATLFTCLSLYRASIFFCPFTHCTTHIYVHTLRCIIGFQLAINKSIYYVSSKPIKFLSCPDLEDSKYCFSPNRRSASLSLPPTHSSFYHPPNPITAAKHSIIL